MTLRPPLAFADCLLRIQLEPRSEVGLRVMTTVSHLVFRSWRRGHPRASVTGEEPVASTLSSLGGVGLRVMTTVSHLVFRSWRRGHPRASATGAEPVASTLSSFEVWECEVLGSGLVSGKGVTYTVVNPDRREARRKGRGENEACVFVSGGDADGGESGSVGFDLR